MASPLKTLIVRHLPPIFDSDEVVNFLTHFGACHVRYMGNKGRLKNCAFATFSDSDNASKALKRLHQLQVSESTLSVEYAKPQHEKYKPTLLDDPELKRSVSDGLGDDKLMKQQTAEKFKEKQLKILQDIDSVCNKWSVQHPLSAKLEYIYPAPTVSILTNIANALASHSAFYVQVLHLMNKMNLPPPFGPITPSPPLAEDEEGPVHADVTEHVEASSEESELESDGDTDALKSLPNPLKRPKEQPKGVRKKHKLQTVPTAVPLVRASNPSLQVEEVFEQPIQQGQKKIELKLSSVSKENLSGQTREMGGFASEVVELATPAPPSDLLEVVEAGTGVQPGGFGKIEPMLKDSVEEETSDVEEEWQQKEFITFKELKEGRLSSEQMKDFSVFKSYSPGEPTTRLYIKNLAKQTTEQDLHRIFGRYVDWSSEEERIMFDIRLMKEGRMKGQAFITLANEEASVAAVKETNSFVLNSKPMVVHFARSAKPKEKDSSQQK